MAALLEIARATVVRLEGELVDAKHHLNALEERLADLNQRINSNPAAVILNAAVAERDEILGRSPINPN